MPREDEGADEVSGSVLNPERFTGFIVAAWRVARPRLRGLIVPFVVVNLLIGGTATIAFVALEDRLTITAVFAIGAAQFLMLTTLGGVVAACCGNVMIEELLDNRIRFWDAFRALGPLRGQLLAACIYAGGLLVVIRYALGPIGYFISLPISLGPPILLHAISVEGNHLREGWRRTRELLQGSALRTFMYLLTFALSLYLVLAIVVTAADFGAYSAGLRGDSRALVQGVLTAILSGVTNVFLAAALLVAYFDARSRTTEEAFTLEDLREETVAYDDSLDEDEEVE